jgi:hypothetical protein
MGMRVVQSRHGTYRSVRWEESGELLLNLGTTGWGNFLHLGGSLIYPHTAGLGYLMLESPPEVRLSLRSSDPWEPVLDWVLDHYGTQYPFLYEVVAKVSGAGVAKP